MAKGVHVFLVLAALCSATFSVAQPGNGAMRANGKLIVNGTPSETTTTIFVDDKVSTDTLTNANLASRGNRIVFTPNSKFLAQRNAFKLESGGTKVATYTQLTTNLPDCYSVTPVSNYLMTLYEVDWDDKAVMVYARSHDIKIKGAGREWELKEGQWARIRNVRLCEPLVEIWPGVELPPGAQLAAAIVGTVVPPIVALDVWDKPKMSPDHP